MKTIKVKYLIVCIISMVFVFSEQAQAQCPASKYGVDPVFPILWDLSEQTDWYQSMENHGAGLLMYTANWRQLQLLADSGELSQMKTEVSQLKSDYNLNQFVFVFQNPARVSNSMPPAWCGNPLTDSVTRNAMFAFIQAFIDTMSSVTDVFVLGSESDLYFKNRPAERDSFMVLIHKVSTFIDDHHPHIRFGVGVSVRNGIQQDVTMLNLIKPLSDILAVNYYPVNSNYMVNPTDISLVNQDIADMRGAAGTMPVYICGTGIPSKTECGSSDSLQAAFIRNVFHSTKTDDLFEGVCFQYLADFDTTKIYWFQNYYITYADEFYHYISSMGMMDSLGNQKQSWPVLLSLLDTLCLQNELPDIESSVVTGIYPNPAVDIIEIKSIQGSVDGKFYIFDLQGRMMKMGDFSGFIDVSGLGEGIYSLQLFPTNGSPEWLRFIKFEPQ